MKEGMKYYASVIHKSKGITRCRNYKPTIPDRISVYRYCRRTWLLDINDISVGSEGCKGYRNTPKATRTKSQKKNLFGVQKMHIWARIEFVYKCSLTIDKTTPPRDFLLLYNL